MSAGIALLLHQSFARAAELTRALLREDCKIAVHIDAKVSGAEVDEYVSEFAKQPNLVITRRIKCEWGTFSLVRAQLIAAQAILEKFPDVSHVVQLSGSCLPTRPIPELTKFLADNGGTDYIESVLAGKSNWIKGGLEAERLALYFPFSWRRQRKLFDFSVNVQRRFNVQRKMPNGLDAYVGSQWWTLSRETLNTIINDPMRKQYDRFFAKCWIPDESYFQTLVHKHGKRIESRSLTYSRFDHQGNPMLFYDDHLEYLEHLEGFFVRKVWHGANRLYNVLLPPDFVAGARDREMRLTFAAQIERLEGLRNTGRAGLSMQSRVMCNKTQSETAAPYSVLVGFDKVYQGIDTWLSEQIHLSVQGDLFGHKTIEFAESADFSAGNVSGNAKIRDYAPQEFITNFIWNHRSAPITFQFWAPKQTKIFNFMAQDPNAYVHYVRCAWVLELMRENITNINILQNRVAELMEMDRVRIEALENGKAGFNIYSLADALSRPALVLYKLIADISPKSEAGPKVLPECFDWEGLETFAKFLRNNGMKIDFELSEDSQPNLGEKTAPVLIAE